MKNHCLKCNKEIPDEWTICDECLDKNMAVKLYKACIYIHEKFGRALKRLADK